MSANASPRSNARWLGLEISWVKANRVSLSVSACIGSGQCRSDLDSAPSRWLIPGPEWHSGGHGFDSRLVHQTFIPGLDSPQVAEGRCGYAGSNKAISVERDSVGEEELLEPLPLVE